MLGCGGNDDSGDGGDGQRWRTMAMAATTMAVAAGKSPLQATGDGGSFGDLLPRGGLGRPYIWSVVGAVCHLPSALPSPALLSPGGRGRTPEAGSVPEAVYQGSAAHFLVAIMLDHVGQRI